MSSLKKNNFESYLNYRVSNIRDKGCINKIHQFQQYNTDF